MKNSIIILILCLIINPVKAQKIIEKRMDFSQKESVVLDIQIADSICIHTWDKKEVFTKASIDVNDNKDNDAYHTDFDEAGSSLKVTARFENEYMSRKSNSLKANITWDVYIPENAGFSVKTINGNIIITGKTSDIKANSISGFIDVTVSPDTKADLDFKTISGTVYSNHEVAFSPKNKAGTTKISDQMNGGGVGIKLETISGDIYFRKM